MGLSTAAMVTHDDNLHTGNASRQAASGLAGLDAASKVIQDPASKGLANGVAPLDASLKFGGLLAADNEPTARNSAITTHAGTVSHKTTRGTYTGNATDNTAIAHGLGVIPKAIVIRNQTLSNFGIINPAGNIEIVSATSAISATATAPDATNFYVLNVMNTNGNVYYFEAQTN